MKRRTVGIGMSVLMALLLLSGLIVAARVVETEIPFEGSTQGGGRANVRAASDYSVLTQVAISRCFSCGGRSSCGVVTTTRELAEGWPIENRSFHINESDDDGELLRFEISGTFNADYSAVSGTYQGVIILCSGWPGPCWEDCRGPERAWSATRTGDITYSIYLPIALKQ